MSIFKSTSKSAKGKLPPPKKKKGKNFLFTLLLLLFIGIVGLGLGTFVAIYFTLPNIDVIKQNQSSQIYDVNGNLISTVHSEENRLPVKITDVPKDLQNAFVAAEDIRFYSHHGIDPKGIMRAVWVNITHQGVAEGGSTITQQLARNAFLTHEQTITRKIREAILAIRIEQKYTKQEILEMYMNTIYFGNGAYGVQAASQTYFGKSVKDLNLAQIAMLAGLPNSPNYYDPFKNPKAAKYRQDIVLGQMEKYGYITPAIMEKAKAEPLDLVKENKNKHNRGQYSYFIDYVTEIVAKKYGDDAVYKGGLRIYTTIDPKAQKAAVEAMQNLPTFYTDKNGLAQPQGALVAINPHNGYIVAMVGGRGDDYFNRAVQAERQPGSAFKPFVYLAALQAGMRPSTILDDKPIKYGDYAPQNYDRNFSGKVTMRYALTNSINTVAVQLADKVGMEKVIDLATEMGLTTLEPSDKHLAAALGGLTRGVTPLDMASAYAVIDNDGIKVNPVAITKIETSDGKILEENTLVEKRIVSAKDAAVLTSMLQSVVVAGTGGNANFGRPAAGKTGTTDDSKDAWFVGYTPNLVAAVWMGDDFGSENLHGLTGGTVPATIWREFMSGALSGTPYENFTVPPEAMNYVREGYESPKKDTDKDKNKKDGKEDTKKEADSKVKPASNSDKKDKSLIQQIKINMQN